MFVAARFTPAMPTTRAPRRSPRLAASARRLAPSGTSAPARDLLSFSRHPFRIVPSTTAAGAGAVPASARRAASARIRANASDADADDAPLDADALLREMAETSDLGKRGELFFVGQARSIHWSTYDPVAVVNADP